MRHPLGFYHVILYKRDHISIRVHYWPGEACLESTAITPYHDHVWRLRSCVLAGVIENVLLDVKQDPEGAFVVAGIRQVNNVDTVVPTSDRVDITIERAVPYRAGECYSIPVGVFHYTRVQTGMRALTIVRSEVVKSEGPRTLVPLGYSGHAPAREYLDGPQAEAVLREVRSLVVADELGW